MPKLKIEMVHDVVCSWCPIGYQNMKQAAELLPGNTDIEWRFLPFQLNPEMPPEGAEIEEHLRQRYGFSAEKQKTYRANLLKLADRAGLIYDFSKRKKYWNTAAAHKLIHWAEGQGKHQEMHEALISYYFTQGKDTGDQDQLLRLVEELGLDGQDAADSFKSVESQKQLDEKYVRAREIVTGGVPAFLINDQYLIEGSNTVTFFQHELAKIAGHENENTAQYRDF